MKLLVILAVVVAFWCICVFGEEKGGGGKGA